MERMSEEEFINNVEEHITSLKNLDNKALKILVGKLEEENKKLKEDSKSLESAIGDVVRENRRLKEEKAKIERELYMAEKTIEDLNLTIKQYEKGFSNGSWLGDDLE